MFDKRILLLFEQIACQNLAERHNKNDTLYIPTKSISSEYENIQPQIQYNYDTAEHTNYIVKIGE